jgi:hypothetical protein
MKKIQKFLLRVLVITGLVLFLFALFSSKGHQTTIAYKGEMKSDIPTQITITNTLDKKNITAEKLSVEIYNEYNKAQHFEFKDVPEVSKGVHKLIVTPDSPGKYIINVTYTHNGEQQKHSEEFNLK